MFYVGISLDPQFELVFLREEFRKISKKGGAIS